MDDGLWRRRNSPRRRRYRKKTLTGDRKFGESVGWCETTPDDIVEVPRPQLPPQPISLHESSEERSETWSAEDDNEETSEDPQSAKEDNEETNEDGDVDVPGDFKGRLWKKFKILNENGIFIQGLGILVRHVLAVVGLQRLFDTLIDSRTVILAVLLWIISGLGVTAGAHRLWSHQSYLPTANMQVCLMIMFSLADQGSIAGWTLTHAMHHSASDTDNDPHNRRRGWWHAHFGWLFSSTTYRLSAEDYCRVTNCHGPAVHFHDKWYLIWDPLWSMALPALIASVWGDALGGLYFAGAFRWAFVQHVTFFVNSVAHGDREPGSDMAFDKSASGIGPRVSILTTLLALGEGWHDYHHMFHWDYAAAELDAWDQWNPTKVFIDLCFRFGLVKTRRRCSPFLQKERRRQLLGPDRGTSKRVDCSFTTRGPLFLRSRIAVPPSTQEKDLHEQQRDEATSDPDNTPRAPLQATPTRPHEMSRL